MRRLLVVWNPSCIAESGDRLWKRTLGALASGCELITLATKAESASHHIAGAIAEHRPDVVAAAGGDGTMNLVLNGILRTDSVPALALFPIGTANAFARELGLPGFRRHGATAADTAIEAVLGGRRRRIDVGQVGERYFGGSFAIGMDADILSRRNRLRHRLGLTRRRGGYALYLLSCAVNTFTAHGGPARLVIDGVEERRPLFNLLITNVPLYAGEFRFDDEERIDDGRLEVIRVGGVIEYLRAYPQAWRRHVRHERGEPVSPPAGLRRVRQVDVELPRPVAAQVDGEQIGPASAFRIVVRPAALEVCVPGGSHAKTARRHDG